LMSMNIREVLIIINASDIGYFERLLGNGEHLGINIVYEHEDSPKGIANAFMIGERFIGNESVALILGDNIYCNTATLQAAAGQFDSGAAAFGIQVPNPGEYGVAEIDADGRVISIEEKPDRPKSDIAVTGLYLYDSGVVDIARSLQPSARGELEITDVNKAYLARGELNLHVLAGDIIWFDAGTAESMALASNYIAAVEKSGGPKVACLEEVAYKQGFITKTELETLVSDMPDCDYRDYLSKILEGRT
jgi:glucose-1-phosphate thymidylyltransferase